MKKIIFWSTLTVITFISLTENAYCQFNDFDLSEYKLPYLKRQQLDLGFNLNPRYNNQSNDNINNISNLNSKNKYQ